MYLDFAKEGFIVLEFLFECGNGFGLAYKGDLCSKKGTSIAFAHFAGETSETRTYFECFFILDALFKL